MTLDWLSVTFDRREIRTHLRTKLSGIHDRALIRGQDDIGKIFCFQQFLWKRSGGVEEVLNVDCRYFGVS